MSLSPQSSALDSQETFEESPLGIRVFSPKPQAKGDEAPSDIEAIFDDCLRKLRFAEYCESDSYAVEELIGRLRESLHSAQETIATQKQELSDLKNRSERLARAQAEAIVYSAEIIDELELTKQRLSEARSNAEAAAEDTRRLADTIFEQTNDAVLVMQSGKCLACNDNAVSLLGQTRERLIGSWPMPFTTATNSDESSIADELRLNPELTAASPQVLEARLQRESGDSFWAEITFSAFKMGDSFHQLIVVRDITARKEFVTELRRHGEFLDNIINAVPDPLSVRKSDQTLVVANDAYCQLVDTHREGLIGTQQVYVSDAIVEAGTDIEKEQQATEHRYELNNGQERIASIKRSQFVDGVTGQQYTISTSRDITEIRKHEKQLELLASVFREASEGIAILTEKGQILEANPSFQTIAAGYGQPLTLTGKFLNDVLPTRIEELDSVLENVVSGQPWSGKILVSERNTVDGAFWVSLNRFTNADQSENRIITLISDITDLESSQAEVKRRAMYDALTGLANRTYYRECLADCIMKNEAPLTVCFLDLDNFKLVNDSAGHSVGDELLYAVSKRIARQLPKDTLIARFGGDEFALIIDHRLCPIAQQSDVLEKLLTSFKEPFQIQGTRADIGLSIGVARFPEDGLDVDSLMRAADIAMYVAKTAGKNRVRHFSSKMQEKVDVRHRIQSRLRDALQHGELELWYQPKVNAATLETVSYEALVRWPTPSGTYISPAEFIPIAEQTGLIGALGDVVFQLAAQQACRWQKMGVKPSIAVNVSPHQVRDKGFISELVRTLERTGAKAEWFELEITEHAMMVNVEHAIEVTNRLRNMGFRIAIDDFGTGYSSLSYLKNFAIDTLKIDISFVRDVEHDVHCQAIARSIVSLGKGLGLIVVAEGVENANQAQLLAEYGCDILQGYYTGRPAPASQIEIGTAS
ncbi:MAG: EAL domain-containing protein [Planctomycetales bacterium]|nr:EAL domain-containing protein [Planctomycetales bacterium]